MKKILFILSILFLTQSVSATVDCTKNGFIGACGNDGSFFPNDVQKYKDYLVDQIRQKFSTYIGDIAHPDNVVNYAEKTTSEIQTFVKEYKRMGVEKRNQTTSTNSSCQKISQTLGYSQDNNLYQQEDLKKLIIFLKNYGENNPNTIIVSNLDVSYTNYNRFIYYAVMAFQKANNIKQTGFVGPITLAKINSLICEREEKIKVSIETPGESGLLGDESKFEASWDFGGKYPKNSYLTLRLKRLNDGYEGYIWPYIGVPTQSNKGTFNLNCLYNCEAKSGQNSGQYKLIAKIVYCSNTNVTDNRFCENNVNGAVTGDKVISVDVSEKIENNPIYLQFMGNLKLENFQQ